MKKENNKRKIEKCITLENRYIQKKIDVKEDKKTSVVR